MNNVDFYNCQVVILHMLQITSIGKEIKQTFTQELPNGEEYIITLEFLTNDLENNLGCFYITLEYKGKIYDEARAVVLSVNLYDDFSNILPYGIGIFSSKGFEPEVVEVFDAGICTMNILTYEEITEIRASS